MSVWVMTIFLVSSGFSSHQGQAVTTQEYSSKESCNKAYREIQNAWGQFMTHNGRPYFLVTCTEK